MNARACAIIHRVYVVNSFQLPRPPVEMDAEQHPPLPQPRRKGQKKAPNVPRGELGDGETGRRRPSSSLRDQRCLLLFAE